MSKPKGRVLIVDDEANIRRAIQMTLESEGYRTHLCDSPIKAHQLLTQEDFDLLLLDIRLGEISGIDLLTKLQSEGLDVPVVFISGNASLTEAAEATRLGAFDFLEKPFTSERLLLTVERAFEHAALKRKIQNLTDQKAGENSRDRLVGQSTSTADLLRDAVKVAESTATVLITGESGTGKELVAQLIHDRSDRSNEPFIKVNCSAIPETLIESELFGYERGAFTGAQTTKRGFFERAHRGTLFFDEIGDMSLNAQAKVLRALQSSEIQKLGSEKVTRVNVRIIAATHRNLAEDVKAGRFREDLFYRISVVPIRTTPLRERREDVSLLLSWFVANFCRTHGRKEKEIASEVFSALAHHPWPGNVRELQNLAERLVIMGGDPIRVSDLPFEYREPRTEARNGDEPPFSRDSGDQSWKGFRERTERAFIVAALRRANGNVSEAATALDIERTYLHRKMTQYEIQKKEFFL